MKVKSVKVKKSMIKPSKNEWAEDSIVDAADSIEKVPTILKKKMKKKMKVKESDAATSTKSTIIKEKKIKKKNKMVVQPEFDDSEQSEQSEMEEYNSASLDKLKEIDPEFYKYLEQNDRKLLKFNPDLDENEESENEDSEAEVDDDDDDDDQLHKPSTSQLEAGSDESDFEDENNTARKENSITLKLLKEWQFELSQDKVALDVIKNVILALNSTLMTLAGETDPQAKAYQVEGAAAFNGVIQLCVLHLESAIRRFLGLHQKTALQPHKCKKWNKIKSSLRGYFTDITKLLEQVSSVNILIVLLKHIHQSIPMILSFTSLLKPILKRLVIIWSTGEETVRVLSFLCILRITRSQQQTVLSTVLKAMYLSYVRNSKFVSPTTLPAINFMRRSLSEMFALDLNVSYQHVFLYIRQLAIHLRNAMTLKKKESFQTVYNWQYVNSIRLWAELLSTTFDRIQLQPLIYPLVSIIIGTIKLVPTAQFFPLRFHCIEALIQLSKETRTFIPVMPFILEVLKSNTFNQRHTKQSMKPLSFACVLRLNKNQLAENGFRDEIIEQIVGCTLDYMAHESFSLSFPELVVTSLIQLKNYIKKDQNVRQAHRSKLKMLVDKLDENTRFMVGEREKFTFDLHDGSAINGWEMQIRNKGTPLMTYYTNWFNTHIAAQKRRTVKSEDIDEYNLPKILKRKRAVANDDDDDDNESDGELDLLPSDEDEEELEIEKEAAKQAKKKQKKEAKSTPASETIENDHDSNNDDDKDSFVNDDIDIVKDLDIDDW